MKEKPTLNRVAVALYREDCTGFKTPCWDREPSEVRLGYMRLADAALRALDHE